MMFRKYLGTWLRRGVIGVWAELCRPSDDDLAQLRIDEQPATGAAGRRLDGVVQVRILSWLDVLVQLALLAVSVDIVRRSVRAPNDAAEAMSVWDSAASSLWRVLQQWPWLWLVLMAVILGALVHEKVCAGEPGNGADSEPGTGGSSQLATELMFLAASAWQSVLARVGMNLSVAIAVIGIPALLLVGLVPDHQRKAEMMLVIAFGGSLLGRY